MSHILYPPLIARREPFHGSHACFNPPLRRSCSLLVDRPPPAKGRRHECVLDAADHREDEKDSDRQRAAPCRSTHPFVGARILPGDEALGLRLGRGVFTSLFVQVMGHSIVKSGKRLQNRTRNPVREKPSMGGRISGQDKRTFITPCGSQGGREFLASDSCSRRVKVVMMGGKGSFTSFLLVFLLLGCDGQKQVPWLLPQGATIRVCAEHLKADCLRVRGGLEPEGPVGKVRCDPPLKSSRPFRYESPGMYPPHLFLQTQRAQS